MDISSINWTNTTNLQRWIASGKKLVILLTGKTGAGKTALINGLIGEEISQEGDVTSNNGGAVTRDVTVYNYVKSGVPVAIIDIPGLQDLDTEQLSDEAICGKIKRQLSSATEGQHVEVVLYCISIHQNRITSSDELAMRHITQEFTVNIWKRTVFVLTFANQFHPRSGDLVQEFKRMINSYKAGIQKALTIAGCPESIVNDISVVPAGYYLPHPQDIFPNDPGQLPGSIDWFTTVWAECANKLDNEPLLAMIAMSSDRFVPSGTEVQRHGKFFDWQIQIDKDSPIWKYLASKVVAAAANVGNRIMEMAVFQFWINKIIRSPKEGISNHPHRD